MPKTASPLRVLVGKPAPDAVGAEAMATLEGDGPVDELAANVAGES